MEFLFGGSLFLAFLFCVVTALFASAVADSKGKSGMLWLILGFFFNIVALIAIAGMPAVFSQPNKRTHMRCPDCREFVYRDAKVCKCCGCKISGVVADEDRGFFAKLMEG